MKRRERRLVPVAEFAEPEAAEEAWVALNDAGIAGSVVGEPGSLGATSVQRVYVAAVDVAAAQEAISQIVSRF